ncbi:MAG: hypothetical protein WCG94_09315 [Methanothrix sp.]
MRSGVILAGGNGRRLGAKKSLLKCDEIFVSEAADSKKAIAESMNEMLAPVREKMKSE